MFLHEDIYYSRKVPRCRIMRVHVSASCWMRARKQCNARKDVHITFWMIPKRCPNKRLNELLRSSQEKGYVVEKLAEGKPAAEVWVVL